MRSTLLFLALALAVGCKAENRDRDDDGVSPAEGDCNDEDGSVFPGATERCDGVDEDCDGSVDDEAIDAGRWYADFDEDGFGDPALFARICVMPDAYVDNGDDCDDSDAAVFPGANEVCNGADDDCDGEADDNAGGIWFGDEDQDTYGDPEVVVTACDGTSGVSADNTDCDDANPEANPGAEERCDGFDNDCDGEAEEDAVDAITWHDDDDSDGFGDPTDAYVGCEAPPGYVENGDDCDDESEMIAPGAPEYCDALDNDCDAEIDEEPVDGETFYGDDDEDGFGDAGSTVIACEEPRGYADNPDDCDDTDASLNADTVWYTDADADGYGDPDVATTQCEQPEGAVINGDDCDDASAEINPDGTETCNGEDDDCDGVTDGGSAVDATVWYLDADGDGYGNPSLAADSCEAPDTDWVANGDDCDDSDAAKNPDTVWYADTDADTYGDASTTKAQCTQPTGYVARDGDCDDTRFKTSPGKSEYCNTYDDDCDGTVDEADAVDAKAWYADRDEDGFGDATKSSTACSAPTGYVESNADCNDADATLNPNTVWFKDADGDGYGDPAVSQKRCSKPTGYVSNDDDCDDTDELLTPSSVWYRDADGDGFGNPSSSKAQCEPPSGYIADAEDCDDTDGDVNPDGLEVCDGDDNDCDGVTDPSDAWWNENWPYRVPVTVTGGAYAQSGPPVLIDVDLKAALAAAGGSGAVDEDTIRVVVQDCDLGQPELPSQFLDDVKGLLAKASHTDSTGDDDGTVAVLYDEDGDYGSLESLAAGETVKLAVYFGTTLDGLPGAAYYTDLNAASSQLSNDTTEANFDRYSGGLLQDLYFTNTSGTLSPSLADQRTTGGNGISTTAGWLVPASTTGSLTLKADGPVVGIVQASSSRSNAYAAYTYTYTYFLFAGRPELWVKIDQKTTASSTIYNASGWFYGVQPWRVLHPNLETTGVVYSTGASYYAVSNGTWGAAFGWHQAPTYPYGTFSNGPGYHFSYANDYAPLSTGGTSISLASGTQYMKQDIGVLLPFQGSYSSTVSSKLYGLMDGPSVSTSSGEGQ